MNAPGPQAPRRMRRRFGRGNHPENKNIIRIALAGNPNSGKTSIFNALTGQRQHIGNYPGVTVEKKSGMISIDGKNIEFIDLPGTYSLSAYSIEEIVSRDFVLNEKPDVIVDVLDSSNLDRHLYLLLQFQELGVPIVGALNMTDEAEEKGIHINGEQLSTILGIPFVKTVGNTGAGIDLLLDVAIKVAGGELESNKRHLNYGKIVELAHNAVIDTLELDDKFKQRYSMHWIAIKLLEKDRDAERKIKNEHQFADMVFSVTTEWRQWLEKHYSEDSEVVIGEQRYAYIHGAIKETVIQFRKRKVIDITEQIDRIVLNRYLGIPIFFAVMFVIYQITFALGNPLSDGISAGCGQLSKLLTDIMPVGVLQDLLTNGIINGVGGVLTFLPLVILLFMGLSFLEDTGYMSRAAFVMDKFLHIFGLHGRSFIPFMISTGCAVPGIMSARVLANRKDRIVTILVSPLMMCGAKAPVVAMLVAAFFPENSTLIFWNVWLFGWLMAFVLALIFKRSLFRGEQTPFVMELPPYRRPLFKNVIIHMWEKSSEYIKKAGTVILAASIVVWFLLSYPKPPTEGVDVYRNNTPSVEYSFGGRLGKGLEPILKWAGFDWKIGVSLVAGVAAKEVIISTLGILYGMDYDASDSQAHVDFYVKDKLSNDQAYSPLMALALMIFIMVYIPCLATLAMVKKELGSWKWPAFQAGYTLLVAFILAVGIYQIGSLLGLGG
ncbi:ferrous iron transport protein B [bacterium]|nr:ferrous iron transport protein B [bacterium]